ADDADRQLEAQLFLPDTAPAYLRQPVYLMMKATEWAGALRFMQRRPQLPARPTKQQVIGARQQQPKYLDTDISTGLMVPESYREAHDLARMGSAPLIVLTAGKPQRWNNPQMARQAAAYQQVWF